MTEKKTPTHDLESIRSTFSTTKGLNSTGTALKSAFALGFSTSEIVATIQTIESSHFQKSMTSIADHKAWQDVYYVPYDEGSLYVKFTDDPTHKFRLLSFKENDNE